MDIQRCRERDRAAAASRARGRGFTMLELVVAVVIAALLAMLAVPSFGSLRRAAGVSTATSELLGALHFARSSAILGGLPVTLCLAADEDTCLDSTAAVATGWLVFAQPDAKVSGSILVTRPILRSFRLPAGVTVQGSRAAVTFWPVTRASSTSTFELCDVDRAVKGRAVVVSQTGRPRVVVEEPACAP